MKRILTLASFALALSFVLGANDESGVREVKIGSELTLEPGHTKEEPKECWVKTNKGVTMDFPPTHIPRAIMQKEFYYCKFVIGAAEASFGGLWTVTTIPVNGQPFEDKFPLRITEKLWIKPSSHFTAYAGEWVNVWIDGNETDFTACTLTNPDGKVYDLINGTNPEIIIHDHGCGVRMRIDKVRWNNLQYHGEEKWKLSQEVDDDFFQFAEFKLVVLKDERSEKEVKNYTWKLGESGTVNIEKKHITLCQFERPDGTFTQMTYGVECEIRITTVTLFHAGRWRAYYARKGQVNLEKFEFNVKVSDLNSLDPKSIPGTGQEINLLCRSDVSELESCSFVRPDQTRIHASIGIGNENYSYYGDGYDGYSSGDRYYADCGLTIHKPSEVDYGLWTCEVGIDELVRAAVIVVAKGQAKQLHEINNPELFVKHGDQLKVQCTVNTPLDYCWFTSPNGTLYSVLANGGDNLSFKYDNSRLMVGDCSAFIEHANTTDSGEWTCHLGIIGSAEIEAKVLVHVTDSYLIPVKTKVYGNEDSTLKCRTFLGEEGTLQYCRWIRPNGHGITEDDASRFKTTAGKTTCELSILQFEPEDIGQWTCVAVLVRARKQEEWATIEVESVQNDTRVASVVSIVLGSGLLVITLIGALFAVLHIYRRRSSLGNVKCPPPYDPEDYKIPHVVQDNSDQPGMDKDYRY